MTLTELDNIVDGYISLLTESEYQDFFKGKLKKYGVKSPSQLDKEKKAEFFAEVKRDWAKQKKQSKKK
jgi:hypothetical protein